MAISLTHTTQAVGADAGTGEIRKAQWNENHTLTQATGAVLGRASAGTGATEELTSLGGVGVFDKARAYLATAQNSSTSWAKANLDATGYDTNSIWDGTNKRFVPKKAGYYLCNIRARTATAGQLVVAVAVNGTLLTAAGADVTTTTLGTGGSAMAYCNGSTDYLEMFALANSARAYTTGNFDTFMEVVGPF